MKKIKLHTWLNNIWEPVFPETYAKLVNRDNEKPDVDTSLNNIEADLTVKSVEIRDLYNNKLHIKPNSIDLLITDGKLNPVYIPDVILGQLQYGGAFNNSDIVTGSPYAELVGINLTTKAPADLAGFYFIYQGPTESHIFKGSEYNIGDWAVCNGAVIGSEWSKIDNTDAVTGIKGNIETSYRKGLVNITPADVGAVDKTGDEMTGNLKVPKLYVSTVSRRPEDTDPLTFTSTARFDSKVTFNKSIQVRGTTDFLTGVKTDKITTSSIADTPCAYIRANADFTKMGISAAKEMGFEINNLVTDSNGQPTYGAVPGRVWGETVSGGNASITYTLNPENGYRIGDSVVSFKVGAGHAGGVYWYRSDGKLGANFTVSVSVDNSNWTKVFDLHESTQLIAKGENAWENTYTSDGISLKEYLQGGKQLYIKFDVMHFTPGETGLGWTTIALNKIGLLVFSIDIAADVVEDTLNEIAFGNSINLGNHEIRDVETLYVQNIQGAYGYLNLPAHSRFNGTTTFSAMTYFESDIHHISGSMFLEDVPLKIKHDKNRPIQWSQFGSDTKFFADAGLLYLRNSNQVYDETRTALVLCAASPTDADPTTYDGVTLYTPLGGDGLYVDKPVYESDGSRVYSSSSVVAGDNILINWDESTKKYTISAAMGVEAPYTSNLTASSWSGSSGAYTFYIAASTHGKGTTPTVLTFVDNEQTYDSPTIDTSGNVTIKSNEKVAMRVIIKR